MWFKRLIVAIVSIAILTPGTIVTGPDFTGHGNNARSQAYRYYPNIDRYLSGTTSQGSWDNLCRIAWEDLKRDVSQWQLSVKDRIKAASCWKAYILPSNKLVVPQAVYASFQSGSTSATSVRRKSGKEKKVRQITPDELARIAEQVAYSIEQPDTFTQRGLAYDDVGRPTPVLSPSATQCDALGWVLKWSYPVLQLNVDPAAYRASELLNEHIKKLTGRSLVAINDEQGRQAVMRALKEVARHLRA